MEPEDAIHLLDRLGLLSSGLLSHPCDLDLLLFFAKHPRCLLPSESLAAFLGYELKVMADSLDSLLAAGLLTRTQTPAHAARLYVLAPGAGTDEWLPPLVQIASTRSGRLALRKALMASASRTSGLAPPAKSSRPGPRRVIARDSEDDKAHTG